MSLPFAYGSVYDRCLITTLTFGYFSFDVALSVLFTPCIFSDVATVCASISCAYMRCESFCSLFAASLCRLHNEINVQEPFVVAVLVLGETRKVCFLI